MPKLTPRVRAIPWLLLAQAAVQANDHYRSQLTPGERERLQKLLKKSKGLPVNLSTRERAEIRRIVGKLDLGRLGRDLVPLAGRRRRPFGR